MSFWTRLSGSSNGDNGLSIADLDIAVDGSGMDNYKEAIKAEVIEKTIEKLADLQENIITAVKKGWQGEAYAQFEEDFKARIKEIQEELEKEGTDLLEKIDSVKKAYYTIDHSVYK